LSARRKCAPRRGPTGLRNPWRMSADRVSGQIWVGTNGQDLWEQAYLLEKGVNYGWSVYEGSHPFSPNASSDCSRSPNPPASIITPISARSRRIVYRGKKFPDLVGAYIYGDLLDGAKIWGMKHVARHPCGTRSWPPSRACRSLASAPTRKARSSSATIAAGEKRRFLHAGATPKERAVSTFPRTLSASGLFKSVKGHERVPGVIPYSVNAPFWSDGAHKERCACAAWATRRSLHCATAPGPSRAHRCW